MRRESDRIEKPGRRTFIKQTAAAGLLAAVAARFPTSYGESTEQRGNNMTRTILMNGKIATLDPAKPRATAVAIKDGVFEAVGDDAIRDAENHRQRQYQTVGDRDEVRRAGNANHPVGGQQSGDRDAKQGQVLSPTKIEGLGDDHDDRPQIDR